MNRKQLNRSWGQAGVPHFTRLQNKPNMLKEDDFKRAEGCQNGGEHAQGLLTCPRRPTKGPVMQTLLCAKKRLIPWAVPRHLHACTQPSRMATQGNWGRLGALLSAARHRQRCLKKWKTRAKCQLQKNMHVGVIRKRPKADPEKDQVNQKNWPMGPWTANWISRSASHKEDGQWWEAPFFCGCGGSYS